MHNKFNLSLNWNTICKIIILIWICITAIKTDILLHTSVKLLLIATLGLDAIVRKRALSKYAIWSMVFLTYCTVSVLWSHDIETTWVYLKQLVINFAILNVIVLYADNEMKIEYIIKSCIFSCIVLSIYTILVTDPSNWGSERIGESTGYLGNVLGIYFSFGLIWLEFFRKNKKASIRIILGCIFFALIVFTGSRVPLFIAVFGLALQHVFASKSKKRLIPSLVISIIGVLVSIYFFIENSYLYELIGWRIEGMVNAFTGIGEVEASAAERLYLSEYASSLISQKPFLGYGLGNFKSLNILGLYAHNNILELLTGLGYIGTILYYWIYAIIFSRLYRNFSNYKVKYFIAFLLITLISEYGVVTYNYMTYQFMIAITFAYTQCIRKNSGEVRLSRQPSGNIPIHIGE